MSRSEMSETVIRHVVAEDAGALLQLYSQPDTMADTLQLPHPLATKVATSYQHAT
ncbi:Uncharacterized N-acetyltransferase yhhY [Erwinia amylovora Ea644]|nr:Uncharacterized N-acetyltransferase yhhY [Erwinia amylovora Ea644]